MSNIDELYQNRKNLNLLINSPKHPERLLLPIELNKSIAEQLLNAQLILKSKHTYFNEYIIRYNS